MKNAGETGDTVIPFPGSDVIGGYPTHPILQEALRESARHGFEQKLSGLYARYADSLPDKPLTGATFLDAGLLFANVGHFVDGLSWKEAFEVVVRRVTSKPEKERYDAIVDILVQYHARRGELGMALVEAVSARESDQ